MLRTLSKQIVGGSLLFFAILVAASGCSKKEQAPAAAAAPPAPAAAAPAVAAPTPPPAAPAGAGPPAAVPVAMSAPVGLGVQEHEVGGVDVALLEVKRTSGDTLTLKWQYRNKTSEDKVLVKEWGSWFDVYRLSAEGYLIDSVNKKKYLVITDADGHPIAARSSVSPVILGAGQTVTTWAKFPAPPPDVRTISVFIAHVPPFEDVPIGK